jgi:alpha-tubulin suppressor-like RCC1 family protein
LHDCGTPWQAVLSFRALDEWPRVRPVAVEAQESRPRPLAILAMGQKAERRPLMRIDSSTRSCVRNLQLMFTALALAGAALCARSALGQEIVGWGQYGFSNIDDLSDMDRIAVGSGHVVALKGDGTVACWG